MGMGAANDAELMATMGEAIATEARGGDLVLVMGARDPSLTDFCRQVLEELKRGES